MVCVVLHCRCCSCPEFPYILGIDLLDQHVFEAPAYQLVLVVFEG